MSKKEVSPIEQHFSASQTKTRQGLVTSGSNETSQKGSGSWKNNDGVSSKSSKNNSECALYDSGRADSGFLSEPNIHSDQFLSEEITDPPLPTSPKSEECGDVLSSGEQKSAESYMRLLDSGVDVDLNNQFSELSVKDDNSLNDLNAPSFNDNNKKKNNLKGSVPPNIHAQTCLKISQNRTEPAVSKTHHSSSWELYFKQDEDGDTQLHIAIIKEFIEVVYSLVRMVPHPSYLDIRNDDCQTPLHLAVLTRQPRMVRRLLCAGASPEIRDRHGNTALHLAVASGDILCVRSLTEPVTVVETNAAELRYTPYSRNIAVNTRDLYNYDDKDELTQLIGVLTCICKEKLNLEGLTCVHLAVLNGHVEILQYLVRLGANINAREWKGGRMPLHLAIERGDMNLCRFLLAERRIDLDAETYAGITPYQMAVQIYGIDANVARQLSEQGCDTYLELTDEEEDDDDNDNDDEMLGSAAFRSFSMNGGGMVNVGA